MISNLRSYRVFFTLALIVGTIFATTIDQPGYTDAYYYFNAGQRLVQGEGLTDPYLWVYINAPERLPGPSHTYWMPLESLVAALGMAIGGANFSAAQIPSVLCLVGLTTLAFWLGARLGKTRRHAWAAGLLVLFSGFFTPFWTTTDTFALYGFVGASSLVCMGRGRESGGWRWYAVGGACCGLAHLTRADGLLLLLILALVALWPGSQLSWKRRYMRAGVGIIAYLLVMLPWFVRNLSEIGTPLPMGGTQTIWLRGYNELVNYPPGVTAGEFLDWGLNNILQSRWEALRTNLGTFIAVETWMVLGPFVLIGLWSHRQEPLLSCASLYAIALHLAMTLAFAYPGYRGGLFHSSSALLPFWAVAGLLGLDRAIAWAARKRRWNRGQAAFVFTTALVLMAILLSVGILAQRVQSWNKNAAFYQIIADDLPTDAVIMINDPPALYYHTGRSGVVVPNADPEVIPEIAARYGVTHLALDVNRTQPFTRLFWGEETRPFLRFVRLYDRGTADPKDDIRLFEIVGDDQ